MGRGSGQKGTYSTDCILSKLHRVSKILVQTVLLHEVQYLGSLGEKDNTPI